MPSTLLIHFPLSGVEPGPVRPPKAHSPARHTQDSGRTCTAAAANLPPWASAESPPPGPRPRL